MAKKKKAPGPHDAADPQLTEGQPVLAGPPKGQDRKAPIRQRGTDDSFTGRSAQLAVMAELMRLRCNAAIPEVDLGTDVFVFQDDREEVVRLQVKGCTAPHDYADGSGYSAKFALPMKQFLRLDDRPMLYYALAVLRHEKWADFLIVGRSRLRSYYNSKQKFGSLNTANNELEITVEFRTTVKCSGQELTDCRNAWGSLPPLQPLPDLEAVKPGTGTGRLADFLPPKEPDQT